MRSLAVVAAAIVASCGSSMPEVSFHDDEGCTATKCGSEHCAEVRGIARCVPKDEIEPRCDANAIGSMFCDGDDLIKCFGPYADQRMECARRGRFCRDGACVVNPEPDPRCTALSGGRTTFCDGARAIQCAGAFHQEEHDCTGGRCVEDGTRVDCRREGE